MKSALRLGFLCLIGFEMLASLGYLAISPDFSILGLVLTASLAWLILEFLDLPPGIFALGLADISLDAFSDMFNMYSRMGNWDTFLHLLGGATGGVIAIYVISRALKKGSLRFKNPLPWIVVSSILLVSFFGTVYEAQEFLTDKYYHHYQKQLGDGPDTVTDLLFNMFGAAIVGEMYAMILVSSEPNRKKRRLAPYVEPYIKLGLPRNIIESRGSEVK